jgi:hypothetical protein
VALDCHRDRSLQKSYGDDNTVLFGSSDQKPFEARQRPVIYPHSLPDLEEGPRFSRKAGSHGSLNRRNLRVLEWDRDLPDTYEVESTGNRQQWKPLRWM